MSADMYNQSLDFEVFQEDLKKKVMDNALKNPLEDMEEISPEILQFFKDLLNAGSTSQLSQYGDTILSESMELLYGTESVLNFIHNYLEDESILSNKEKLIQNIHERHLKLCRRLL